MHSTENGFQRIVYSRFLKVLNSIVFFFFTFPIVLKMIQFCCFKATFIAWLETIVMTLLAITVILAVFVPALTIYLKFHFKKKRERSRGSPASVAFFHPYCNAISGRERLLWSAVSVIHKHFPACKIVIFTGDIGSSPSSLIDRAKSHYNVQLPENIEFLYLSKRRLIENKTYPYLSDLCLGFGSLILGLEAISLHLPDVLIDTMGWSFVWPLFSFIGGCKVAAYIHSPTIMPKTIFHFPKFVANSRPRTYARSPLLAGGDILYRKIVSWLYAVTSRTADIIMVNSTWSENLVHNAWDCPMKTFRVYPPCDIKDLETIPLEKSSKSIKIISVGQFRPEKDHPMQLKVMYQLRQNLSEEKWNGVKLVIIGSTQTLDDSTHFKDMQDLCKHLSLENNVEFKVDLTYNDLKDELTDGVIGLHTMPDEHFGVALVEMMAAGLIVVAHETGGPKSDIIETKPRNGFLALSEMEYADKITSIINSSNKELIRNIQHNARASVERFSVSAFNCEFLRIVQILFPTNNINS